jgi:hypothetical protein
LAWWLEFPLGRLRAGQTVVVAVPIRCRCSAAGLSLFDEGQAFFIMMAFNSYQQ